MVFKLKELVQRIDGKKPAAHNVCNPPALTLPHGPGISLALLLAAKLHAHLEKQGLTDFMQLFFRWMNCQLLRDLPHKLVIRLWDTLMSEEEGFEGFVV